MTIQAKSDSGERRAGDYVLFALAFASFVLAGGGVIVSSPSLAFLGATVLVLVLLGCLRRRPPK